MHGGTYKISWVNHVFSCNSTGHLEKYKFIEILVLIPSLNILGGRIINVVLYNGCFVLIGFQTGEMESCALLILSNTSPFSAGWTVFQGNWRSTLYVMSWRPRVKEFVDVVGGRGGYSTRLIEPKDTLDYKKMLHGIGASLCVRVSGIYSKAFISVPANTRWTPAHRLGSRSLFAL